VNSIWALLLHAHENPLECFQASDPDARCLCCEDVKQQTLSQQCKALPDPHYSTHTPNQTDN